MTFQLLDSLAMRGAASIHARGRFATSALLSYLPEDLEAPVLEIGCGTGETAVQLCQYAETVVAVDASARMLKIARGRSKWCGLEPRLPFMQVSVDHSLPFAAGVFSAVVIESVLAIQSPETLDRLVRECARVVRPRGRVVVNETVWMADTPRALAEEINQSAAESVGIIQASSSPFDADAWTEMFEARGLSLMSKQRLDDLPLVYSVPRNCSSILIRSRAYTTMRRVRALFAPGGIADQHRIAKSLADLAPPQPCLEGVLFVLERK